jgi:hypothetical protein
LSSSDPTRSLSPAVVDDFDLDLDLDATSTAANEAAGRQPAVKIGGRRLTVPSELPLARRLVGDEQYAQLCEARPTLPQVGALVKFLASRYGVGLGEASPSSDSSEGTGTTSSATSSGSTDSTSAKSGGGRGGRRKAS